MSVPEHKYKQSLECYIAPGIDYSASSRKIVFSTPAALLVAVISSATADGAVAALAACHWLDR